MSKKLLALLLAMIMVIGSFTSVLADTTPKADEKKAEEVKTDKKDEAKPEEKKDEAKPEEKKDEAKPEEKTEEKKEEKKEEPAKDEALERAMDVLKKAEVIEGFKAGEEDFKAEKNVTRAEFAAMIVRANNLKLAAEAAKATPTGFIDVPVTHWANGYIAIAKNQKYINGYPTGKFMPEGQITYQEMAKMLVCALGKGEVGDTWPTSYIVKAQSLGLLNGVTAPVFTEKATRGDVFKMLYNMMNNKEFGNRKILRAIVLENSRVEKLADDEITVEVIDVVQKADWADKSRDKKGDQHTYKLSKELLRDPEELLGKVVNITVDKNDTVLEIEKDKTYDYVEGKIQDVTNKKIKVAGTYYTVGKDERYDERDERIFRTYLNDKSYSYVDFATKYESKRYDFARITVKNGKVIFIDAYQFDDVSPVAEVKDGNVYYLDDTRDARVSKATDLEDRVVFHDAKGYSVADKKDIVKDDVIHFYNNYENAIVRKDAKVQAKFEKTLENADGEWVVTKDAQYRLRTSVKDRGFKAIYSLEGKNYFVVDSRFDLRLAIEDDVKILLALDNTVQLVESAKSWKDGIYAINRIASFAEVQLLPSKEEPFWAKETRDTSYFNPFYTLNSYSLQMNFKYGDIVYYEGNDKNEIGRMGVIIPRELIKDNVDLGYLANLKKSVINDRYISSGDKQYRYFDNLKAYSLNDRNELEQIKDFDKFVKDNKNNTLLRSYVLSEAGFGERLRTKRVEYYKFISDNDRIASAVIFKNAVNKTTVKSIYAMAKDKFSLVQNRNLTDARFVDADGKEYIVRLTDILGPNASWEIDDIVELELIKDTIDNKDKVLTGRVKSVVIPDAQESVTLDRFKKGGRDTYEINGKEVYFYSGTTFFNNNGGNRVKVAYFDSKEDCIEVIRFVNEYGRSASILTAVNDSNPYYPTLTISKDGKLYSYLVDINTVYSEMLKDEYGRPYKRPIGRGNGALALFKAMYENGVVSVEADMYNKVIEITGLKDAGNRKADIVKKHLDDAEKAVKALAKNNEVEVPSTAASEQAGYEALVKEALAKAGLLDSAKPTNDVVTVAVAAATSGNANKYKVTITSKLDTTKNVVVDEQHVTKATSAAEDKAKNAKVLEMLLKEVSEDAGNTPLVGDGTDLTTAKNYILKELEKLAENDQPKYKEGTDYVANDLAVTAVKATNNDNPNKLSFEVTVEYGSANKAEKTIILTIDKPAK